MKRSLKYALCMLVLLFWVTAMGFALEFGQRVLDRRAEKQAEAYEAQRSGENFAKNDAIIRAHQAAGAPMPGDDMRLRDEYPTLDEKGRADFAARRKELILTCDRQGTVQFFSCASEPPEIVELGRLVHSGESIATLLPEVEGKDVLLAIDAAFAQSNMTSREYTIPLSSGTKYLSEWYLIPVKDAGGRVTALNVFIRDSVWEATWEKFRKNVYRNDAYVFQTNSRGFRDREFAVPKPAGVVRLACVGGSTTVEGPTNELTYPKMLERKFREHFGTDRVEVVDCGVFAITTGTEVKYAGDVLALQPDLLVHYNYVNDVPTLLSNPASMNGQESIIGKLKQSLRQSQFLYRYFNWQLLPPTRELENRIDEITLADLKRLNDLARGAGVDVALCSFAYPRTDLISNVERRCFDKHINNMLWGRILNIDSYAKLTALYNARLRAMCERDGIIYIPVAEAMPGGMDIFSDICHMHLESMDRKAQVVFDALKDYVAARLAQTTPPAQ